jgi:hypothetical protein
LISTWYLIHRNKHFIRVASWYWSALADEVKWTKPAAIT